MEPEGDGALAASGGAKAEDVPAVAKTLQNLLSGTEPNIIVNVTETYSMDEDAVPDNEGQNNEDSGPLESSSSSSEDQTGATAEQLKEKLKK